MSNAKHTAISLTYAEGIDPNNWQIRDTIKFIKGWIKPGETWCITQHHRGGFQYGQSGKKPAKGHKVIVTVIAAAKGEQHGNLE